MFSLRPFSLLDVPQTLATPVQALCIPFIPPFLLFQCISPCLHLLPTLFIHVLLHLCFVSSSIPFLNIYSHPMMIFYYIYYFFSCFNGFLLFCNPCSLSLFICCSSSSLSSLFPLFPLSGRLLAVCFASPASMFAVHLFGLSVLLHSCPLLSPSSLALPH